MATSSLAFGRYRGLGLRRINGTRRLAAAWLAAARFAAALFAAAGVWPSALRAGVLFAFLGIRLSLFLVGGSGREILALG